MKYLKKYKTFESIQNLPSPISISDFVNQIRLPESKKQDVINWWDQNRKDFNIHYFPFSTPQPIAGCFLGENSIAINSKLMMPAEVKLFLALHESGHSNQHREGRFMSGYFDTVVNGDRQQFLKSYVELEKDANDFAENAMNQMGFQQFFQREMLRLRSNERAGDMVYQMMTSDINRFKPVDFFDLLEKQIL
jgi:hypothetical protein